MDPKQKTGSAQSEALGEEVEKPGEIALRDLLRNLRNA